MYQGILLLDGKLLDVVVGWSESYVKVRTVKKGYKYINAINKGVIRDAI